MVEVAVTWVVVGLVAWVVMSVPFGVVVGRCMAMADVMDQRRFDNPY